jgi:bifunctional N-acetylglucosamine-1-phosphate-uridyltransferase/glucosamine-1-phosphate-acetyltransferase GlmU-like protein
MLTNESLFEMKDNCHPALIQGDDYAWEALNLLKDYINDIPSKSIYSSLFKAGQPLDRTVIIHEDNVIDGKNCNIIYGKTTSGNLEVYVNDELLEGASVIMSGSCLMGDKITLGKGVLVESGAMIKSPAIIGDFNEIRQGAYLRGYVLTGRGCVLGHTTEIKHSIFLNDAKAGHFNYIGDSILGNNTNLGAGTKFANLRFFAGNVLINHQGKEFDTGRNKLGAILGDNTQTGCNSVTNPGAIFGKNSFVMPNATARSGYHEPGAVVR